MSRDPCLLSDLNSNEWISLSIVLVVAKQRFYRFSSYWVVDTENK
jgi:hypothetical protein